MDVLIEQIKVDLYIGFEFFEYEGTWEGWDWNCLYEEKHDFIGFFFRNVENPKLVAMFNSTLSNVTSLELYDFIRWIDSNLYYNSYLEGEHDD